MKVLSRFPAVPILLVSLLFLLVLFSLFLPTHYFTSRIRDLMVVLVFFLLSVSVGFFVLKTIIRKAISPSSTDAPLLSFGEETVLGFGLGMGALSCVGFLLASLRLYTLTGVVLTAALLGFLSRHQLFALLERMLSSLTAGLRVKGCGDVFWLIAMVVAVLWIACIAFLPPTGYDALEYHLGVQSEYISHGGFATLPFNVFSNFPMGAETLYGLGMIAAGDGVAQPLHALFAILTAISVAATTKKILVVLGRESSSGFIAPAVFLSLPFVFISAGQANNDLAVAFYASSIFLPLLCFPRAAVFRGLLIGLMCGFAIAVKYTAIILVFCPIFVVLAMEKIARPRAQNERSFLSEMRVFLIAAALPVLPWMIKNLLVQHNPFFPFLYGLLGGYYWSPDAAQVFQNSVSPKFFHFTLERLLELHSLCADSFGLNGVARSTLLPVWIGVAASAFFFRDKISRPFWLFVGLSLLGWLCLTHWQDRFLLPAVPALVVISVVGLQSIPYPVSKRAFQVVVGLLVAWNSFYGYRVLEELRTWEVLSGRVSREEWQSRGLPHFEALRTLNERLDPSCSRVLFVAEARTHGCRLPNVAGTVFDRVPLLEITRGTGELLENIRRLRDTGFTHILYNTYELQRLEEMYGGYGWTKGVEIRERMERLAPGLKEIFCVGDLDRGVFIYEIQTGAPETPIK